MNKVGDLFLLSGICLAFAMFYSVDFSTLNNVTAYQSQKFLELIVFFLFLGAVGKSAQIGLHA